MDIVKKKAGQYIRLRWMCRAVVFGSTVFSVWANVLHAGTWNFVTWLFAAAPPILVLVGWEMVSRIPIRRSSTIIRFIRPIATAAIIIGSAWLSYWHQRDAIAHYTPNDLAAAKMLPLLVDGLMVIASVSVYELNGHLRDLEVQDTAKAILKRSKRPQDGQAAPVSSTATISRKAEIVKLLQNAPNLSAKEVATLTGSRESYVNNVRSALTKQNGNGHAVATI